MISLIAIFSLEWNSGTDGEFSGKKKLIDFSIDDFFLGKGFYFFWNYLIFFFHYVECPYDLTRLTWIFLSNNEWENRSENLNNSSYC